MLNMSYQYIISIYTYLVIRSNNEELGSDRRVPGHALGYGTLFYTVRASYAQVIRTAVLKVILHLFGKYNTKNKYFLMSVHIFVVKMKDELMRAYS